MQRAKKWAALLLMMSLSLVLAGCAMPKLTLDPEELYALPELPARYTTLNQQLNAIQESSAEYAAPVSGSNIQPVQMVDLDGDGREEALAFFRQSDGEKPLKFMYLPTMATAIPRRRSSRAAALRSTALPTAT